MQIEDHVPEFYSAWQPGIADEVLTTERSHDLKFDIYILFSYSLVQKRWVIYQNLRSICTYLITSCVHVRNLHPRANVQVGANLLNRICTTSKGATNLHPDANLPPSAFS